MKFRSKAKSTARAISGRCRGFTKFAAFVLGSLMLALLLPSGDALAASRIKDITDFEGVRDNQLIGYGLVVGINRTGDKLSNSPFTKQSLVGMLERLGVNIRGINLNSTNIAAVMVTATLPAFVRHGSRIDVTVSALGDASSLLGGTLIATPLMGADDNVYAVAQGQLAVGGFSAEGADGSKISKGVPTSARIAGGAIIEREVGFELSGIQELNISLRNPDFTTSKRIAQAINAGIGENVAKSMDSGTVRLTVPDRYRNDIAAFLTAVEQMRIEPDQPARVVIDETSGVIVMGENGQAEPPFNVIALFDSTSLSPLTPATPGAGLGLGLATQISDGASNNISSAASLGGDALAPAVASTATTNAVLQAHPTNQAAVLKGITAADVAAEIAHLDIGAVATPPATADGKKDSSAAPVSLATPATAQSLAAGAPVVLVAAAVSVSAATPIADVQASREGEAPDPRVTSQIVQAAQSSLQERASPQARAAVAKAAAKPTTGLSSALSGDVALAAMAIEAPKPVANGAGRSTPTAGQGLAETVAGRNANANATQPSFPAPSQQPTPALTGQSSNQPGAATLGQAFEQAALGGDAVRAMAEIADQPAAPRASVDVRVDSLQAAPQSLRVGETAGQTERPTTLPAPPNAPPAEQVAMQLRNAVAKGVDKITIQLSPASLGAVDVTLEISSGARVVVHVVADRIETLDLLRADARALDRALQEAGLRTEQGSLNFNLRGDGNNNASQQNATASNKFDQDGTDGGAETDGDSDPGADDSSPDQPLGQESNQALDIEV
jgi:flagellar P-ring protein precursor FlgI